MHPAAGSIAASNATRRNFRPTKAGVVLRVFTGQPSLRLDERTRVSRGLLRDTAVLIAGVAPVVFEHCRGDSSASPGLSGSV